MLLTDQYNIEACPFCGNDEKLSIKYSDEGIASVLCGHCNAQGPEEIDDDVELIIQAWNERGVQMKKVIALPVYFDGKHFIATNKGRTKKFEGKRMDEDPIL